MGCCWGFGLGFGCMDGIPIPPHTTHHGQSTIGCWYNCGVRVWCAHQVIEYFAHNNKRLQRVCMMTGENRKRETWRGKDQLTTCNAIVCVVMFPPCHRLVLHPFAGCGLHLHPRTPRTPYMFPPTYMLFGVLAWHVV